MSRIGKLYIDIPTGVTVQISDDNLVTMKGPKGEMTQKVSPDMKVEYKDNKLTVMPVDDAISKETNAKHGLYRALLNNMVIGISKGFSKKMEMIGVGYRASNKGQLLELSLGYTHNIIFQLPDEIKVETKMERNKNPYIRLESCNKQLLGQVCAKIRSFRMPEPYKGKGIRFIGEEVRRKAGKTAAK